MRNWFTRAASPLITVILAVTAGTVASAAPQSATARSGRLVHRVPVAAASTAPCTSRHAGCYDYAGAFQFVNATGAGISMPAAKETLGRFAFHSIVELAVESANEKNVVEVGWYTNRATDRSRRTFAPRFFTDDWDNGVFQAASQVHWVVKNMWYGHQLQIGHVRTYAIEYSGGRWWVSFNRQRVAYIPASVWGGKFERAGLVQVFGEIAGDQGRTCTTMGDGRFGTSPGSLQVQSFRLFGTDRAGDLKANPYATRPGGWDRDRGSRTAFRLGGPGFC